jgi:hypothetical protein
VRRLTILVLIVALVSCGGSDEQGGVDDGGNPVEDGGGTSATVEGETAPSGAELGEHERRLPNGYVIELLGWSRWPFTGWPGEGARSSGVPDRVPVALRVEVCAGNDAEPLAVAGGLWFAVGGAAGDLLDSEQMLASKPLVSPALLDWPDPGSCTEGWTQPMAPVSAEPSTAVWVDRLDEGLPVLVWDLGDPYEPAEHPTDGEVLVAGETLTLDAAATWTVFGVSRLPAADPDAVVPAEAYRNAGQGFDLPPAGFEWAAIDAEYCYGSAPGTVYGNIGLVVDGWSTRVEATRRLNAGPDHVFRPVEETGCIRGLWYAPVAPDATVTGVSSSDGGGPWWLVTG